MTWFKRKPKVPFISTDSPCPACGNAGCKLAYDAIEKHVKRLCNTCGCVVIQPPVAPELFKGNAETKRVLRFR